jgi:EAL domain-containing protein (putative c-di-GMP-specific phosphodiesterase class I)
MDRNAQARRRLENDLREALTRGEFELFYQPLVGAQSGKITTCEALLRWRHPERGMVSPAEFIPVAEEMGLIVRLGAWVLEEACREATRWPDHIKVAVNLSPVQFKAPHLVATVSRTLAASGLRPERLELEITESVLLDGDDATRAALYELRALGVLTALDDFGTGYSSLSYLGKFPFDKLKIDRCFVAALTHDEGSRAIVRAIVAMATSLGMRITAEGVEGEEQAALLRAMGCTEVQGFLYSRPRPAAETRQALIADDLPDSRVA